LRRRPAHELRRGVALRLTQTIEALDLTASRTHLLWELVNADR
jgi:hypothetical protein